MKIAIIAHCLHPVREPFQGGLEMVTFLLCKSLMARGHDVHLYAHRDSDPVLNVIPIPMDRLFPNTLFSEMRAMGQEPGAIRELLAYTSVMQSISEGGYDIVHNHSLHYIPILMGNALRIPMLTSIHTPKFAYLRMGAHGVRKNERQTFTMVSKSLAATWEDLIPTAKVVNNGIDLSNWKPTADPTLDYVVWCGRICPEKGTDLAIKSALRAGIPIKLAGPISNQEYYDAKVSPLVSNIGVEYLGHMEQNQLEPLFGNALAMLFTSTWEEPYGLTLAESLACGTPVVAFDGGATREILTDETGIIVPKYDVDGLADAILNSVSINRSACRTRAENFCSHHVMVDDYLEIYDELLERKEYKILTML